MEQKQNVPAPAGEAPAKKAAPVITVKAKPRSTKYYIFSAISIIIMFGFGLVVKPWSTVTEMGVKTIGVFLGVLFAVLSTNELLWPSLAGLLALLFHGYYATAAAAVAGFFGNTTVFQFIMMQGLIRPVIASGAGEIMARMILTRKFLQGKPYVTIFMFFIAFLVAGNFMGIFGCVFLAFPILKSFLTQAGYDMKDKFSFLMYTGVFIFIMVSAAVKSGITANGLLRIGYVNTAIEDLGITVNLGTYTVAIIVCQLLFMIVYTFSIGLIFRCDLSKLRNTNFREMPGMLDNLKFSPRQTVYLLAFVVYVLYSFFISYIPKTGVIGKFMNGMGLYLWAVLIYVVMSFIEMKDETGRRTPIFNAGKMLKEAVSWDMAFVMGFFTVIGGALAGKDSGVSGWLSELFAPLLSSGSSWLFLLMLVALVTIVTNFFSNIATGNLFAVLGAAICKPFVMAGMNPALVACIPALTASCAFLTYGAAGPAPLYLDEEAVDSKKVWTYGLIVLLMFIIVTTLGLVIMDIIL